MNKHSGQATANGTASPIHSPINQQVKTQSARTHRAVGDESNDLDKLAILIEHERDALLSQWRQKVRELPSASKLDVPTLNDHIPDLLSELSAALRLKSDQTIPAAIKEGKESSASDHGRTRLKDGFDIEEVLGEYNILRGCIHDLADNNGLTLQGRPFHTLNKVFDHAIGLALQTYTTQHALNEQGRREEYLAFVAHDLRNPLHAISLAGSILEGKFPDIGADEVPAQMLKTLRRNVQQIEHLVGKVLEENANLQTESGAKLERRNFDLWPLVEALIHDLHPVAGTGSTKLLNKVPYDLAVCADASLLKRVFQNLIANAIKYTPRGEIIIGAGERGEEGVVECWVTDNGEGIPKNLIEKIFDKGVTDNNHEEGMGLGLAIVKTFVEAHAGKVTVESQEGAGSTFRFTLSKKAG